MINLSSTECLEEFFAVGQNVAIIHDKISSKEISETLPRNWYEKEHMNGQYHGWMKLISSLPDLKEE